MADFNIQVGAVVKDTLQKQLDGFTQKTVTVKPILDTKGVPTNVTKTVTDWTNAQGDSIKTTEKFNKVTKESSTVVSQYKKNCKSSTDAVNENSKAMKTNATSMDKTTDSSKKLGQSMLDIATKVAKFYVITKAIQTVQRAMGEAVTTVKEYDKAFTEASKVSDMSADGLESYAQRLGEIGQETARTRTEMLQGATEFLKAGYNEEESAILARSASLFQNIADSELSASQASEVIISNLKAFNMTATESSNVISTINEISNTFAVSSTDLSLGLSKTATAMATLGNSFSESASLMVGAGEQLPNQSGKIARGLRSIGLEIAKTAQSSKTLKVGLDGTEIALYDQEGAMRSTYDILKDLYPLWQNMSEQEKASIGLTIAKKNNYEVLSATMNGYGNVIKANEVALASQGSAERENAKYMESLEGKAKLLKSAFGELVLGKGGLQSVAKTFLDISSSLLKFANSDAGRVALAIGAITGAIMLLQKGYAFLKTTTIASTIAMEIQMATLAGTSATMGVLTGVVNALSASIMANPLLWGLAVAGVLAVTVTAMSSFGESVEDVTKKLEELVTQQESLTSEQEKLTSKSELTKIEQQRLDLLNAQIIANKQLIQDEYDKLALARESESNRSFGQTYAQNGKKALKGKSYNQFGSNIMSDERLINDAGVKDLLAYYDILGKMTPKTVEDSNKIEEARKRIVAGLTKEGLELQKRIESGVILSSTDEELYGSIMKVVGVTEKSTDATKTNTDTLDENSDSADTQRSKLEELQEELNAISGMSLTGLTDAFDLMRNAQDEMNSASGLTAETFEQMMSLGSEYLAVLLDQTGALDSTTDAQIALYNAKIDDMTVTASIAQYDLAMAQVKKQGVGAYANLTAAIYDANKAKQDELSLTIQQKVASGELGQRDAESLTRRIDSIRQWGEQAKNSIKINNGFTHATKSSTKANKENADSLNDLKKSYEKVIGYINDKVDDQIDKLKELKDTALDSIDAQIDKLNEQKDAEEKSWNAKIDALNAQNDAIEQQIELEQLQANLAMARNKKVLIYREGRGFGYESDMGAVNEAQKELDEFNRKKKFEDEVKQLENFRDLASQNYDKQIADLEKYRKSVESNYDAQIKYYEDWKKSFKDSIDAYENEQNRLLALQLTGIDFEKANWQARLNNLASFVSSWNALQAKMANNTASSGGGGAVSAPTISSGSVTGGGGRYDTKTLAIQQFMSKVFGIQTSLNGIWDNATTAAVKKMQKQIGLSSPNGLYNRPTYLALAKYMAKHNDGRGIAVPMYASGIASVPDNQMALVGDNPNSELVIGGKLNGTMTKLSKDSRVIDAKTTRNIMGLSNSINGGGASYNTYDNNQPITINNLNLELKGVTDGEGFSKYITHNLRNEIYQKNKSRR